ncbi:LLM class oxidoreductase [Streptomyces sp. NBC_01190]|uniref:LLM class oxidoreductase n=1 Tax=Streptomyces sp. NBC_01190 TaxID=2903767 RepID=UPI00386BF3F7|nr:LLM class oxidoreductase [Streptomyces sp. NBC_01190]
MTEATPARHGPVDVEGRTRRPFSEHRAMARAYPGGRMTLGAIAPLEGYRGAVPSLAGHTELIQQAERAGFASVWVRDVPLLDPYFGDAGQVFDPWVYLGHLGACTGSITLGTASIALPLRHPLHTAKAASTVDRLSGGRLLLGVATGDRLIGFPAFGQDSETRDERFPESLAYFRAVLEQRFPEVDSPLGRTHGTDLLPKPVYGRIPVLMRGRGGQDIDWIAENTDGRLSYTPPFQQQAANIRAWRALTGGDSAETGSVFKPYAQATALDLSENPLALPSRIHQGYSVGRSPFLEMLLAWQEIGVDQLMLNFKQSRRPVSEVIDELAEYVLPHFPPGVPVTDEEKPLVKVGEAA